MTPIDTLPAKEFDQVHRSGVAGAERQLRLAPPHTWTPRPLVWPVRVVALGDVRLEEGADVFAPFSIP
jgi:hypothetical protein